MICWCRWSSIKENGEIVTLKPEDLKFTKRSSALKRGEIKGVILSVTLRKQYGDAEQLKVLAEKNHNRRLQTQPGPKDNLGSIYSNSTERTIKGKTLHIVAKVISILLKPIKRISTTTIMLYMTGHKYLIPYVWWWNRYIWKDEQSHELFWKFHRIHQKVFKKSDFEIEIKGERMKEL